MTRKLLGVLAVVLLLVCLQGIVGTGAKAQAICIKFVSCSQYSLYGPTCEPPLPKETIPGSCFPSGPWAIECSALSYECPPRPCNCEKGASSGHPIALVSGNTYIEENDIRIPGLGGGLALDRRWNSIWPVDGSAYQIGLFGPNWRSTFEERIFVGSDHFVKYLRSDGSVWSFGYAGNGTHRPAAPANVAVTMVDNDSNTTITFQNGEQRVFDPVSGKLTAMVDRNGNTTTLSYDSNGRLTTVTDPASRHIYFNYASPSGSLVTSVTSDFGVSVTYSYDSQNRLSQVTEPDQSILAFQYDNQSFILSVTDGNGKVLESHTYDSAGRGLTSSRANGVDAVTLSYSN